MCSTSGVAEVWTPAALAQAEPGLEMIAALETLVLADLSRDDQLYVVEAWERVAAYVAARSHAAVASFAGPVDRSGQEPAREELVAALRWGPGTAQIRIDQARHLTEVLPDTWAALEAGRISARYAAEFVRATENLTPETAAMVEARVLPKAPEVTMADLKRRLRLAVARADTRSFEERHAKAARERRVELWPGDDGMSTLAATLPAAEAQTVFLALDTLARIPDTPTQPEEPTDPEPTEATPADDTGVDGEGAEPTKGSGGAEGEGGQGADVAEGGDGDAEDGGAGRRGIDARRADALVALAEGALARPDLPKAHGRKVAVQVVIDLPTLLGLRESPAELVGYGPLPASVARALAVDAAWTRLVVDPVTGHLLDYGTTQYRPPQALKDYILAGTAPAAPPTAGNPPTAARSTTTSPTPPDTPARTTADPSANTTTCSKPTPAGPSNPTPTAA